MKRIISCAITFCLAFSLFGVPSLAFAKDALAGEDTSASAAEAVDGSGSSSSSSASSAGQSSQQESAAEGDADNAEGANQDPVVESVTSQDNVKEVVDGDVTFFGVEDAEAQANAKAIDSKGSQISGGSVTVKLRSQIHPTSPSKNLTTDFGVKATLVDASGSVVSTAEFVPARRATDADADNMQIIGDYTATFPSRIPQGTYDLQVSGQNYLTHLEKDFFVEDGNRISVELVDMVTCSDADTSVSTTVGNKNNIQGLLPYGDFNGDGRIDNNDTWMMTRALSQPASAENVNRYDVNADGVFNLLDAQYFATTIKGGNDTASSVEELIKVVHGRPVITKDCSLTKVSSSNGVIKIGTIGGSDNDSAPGEGDDSEEFVANALREALFENSDSTVILEQADPISEANHISLDIETTALDGNDADPDAETVSNIPSGSVSVEDEDGTVHEFEFKNGQQTTSGRSYSLIDSLLRSNSEQAVAAGTGDAIVIDFGTRIAIKKITIKVTATTQPNATLAEIGKVAFLNNMEDRIEPPDLSIPTNLKGEPGEKSITFSWDPQQNITG